jgi:hypothetical protein
MCLVLCLICVSWRHRPGMLLLPSSARQCVWPHVADVACYLPCTHLSYIGSGCGLFSSETAAFAADVFHVVSVHQDIPKILYLRQSQAVNQSLWALCLIVVSRHLLWLVASRHPAGLIAVVWTSCSLEDVWICLLMRSLIRQTGHTCALRLTQLCCSRYRERIFLWCLGVVCIH